MDLDNLKLNIQASSESAESNIDQLIATLTQLKAATEKSAPGLTNLRVSLDKLGNIKGVTATLNNLSNTIKSQRVDYSSLSGEISKVANSFAQLSPEAQKAARQAATAANSLRSLSGTTYKPSVDAVSASLKSLSSSLQGSISWLGRTKINVNEVSSAYAQLPTSIQRAISANSKLVSSNKQVNNSFGALDRIVSSVPAKFGAAYLIFRQVASVIAGWIKESNDYVENLNLFTVAMGEYASEAQAYAEQVGELMGIDPSAWMRNQGVFMTLATGFGVANDQAALMSKNLTQLGYDLSSFFNISVEDAMQKLQSGISGELEPLRRLGYDLSEARLKAIALANGIDESVSSMTQAEKSQLRYVAIMTQVTTAQGDMARTLQAPANQIRILQASITQAARALGNIFIPALNAILPYVIAFVNVIRWAAQQLADLFGFELPEVDYSGVNDLASAGNEAGEALEDASNAAKDLKNAVLGIDELNVISPNTGNKESGAGGTGGNDLGIELPSYDFLGDAVANRAKEIEEALKPIFDDILAIALAIGSAIAAWRLSNTLFKDMGKLTSALQTISKLLGSAAVIGIEFMLAGWTMDNYLESGDIKDLIANALTIALASALLYKFWGPAGLIVGVAVGVAANLNSLAYNLSEGITTTGDPKTWIAAAETIAYGALAGYGFAKLAKIPVGYGMAIGTLVTAGLTLATINYGAIAGGEYDFGSWKSALLSALSTAALALGGGLVGAQVGSIGGPLGAAIGFVIGVIINIGAIVFGDKKNLENLSFDTLGQIGEGGADFSGITENFAANADLSGVNESIESVRQEIESITSSYEGLGTAFEDAAQEATSAAAVLQQGIDFSSLADSKSLDGLSSFLDELVTNYQETEKELNSSVEQIKQEKTNLEKAIQETGTAISTSNLKALDDAILGAEEERAATLEGMRAYFTEIGNITKTQLIDGITAQAEALSTAYEEKSPVYRFFVSEEKYVHNGLESYQTNIVDPMLAKIEAGMNEVGMDGSAFALAAGEEIGGALSEADTFVSFPETVKNALSSAWDSIQSIWTEKIPVWWETNVAPWFTLERWKELFYSIGHSMGEAVGEIVSFWTEDIPAWWNEHVAPWFTLEKWKELVSSVWKSIQAAWNSVVSFWTEAVPAWWDEHVAPWFTLEKWKELGGAVWSGLVEGLGDLFEKAKSIGKDILDGLLDGLGWIGSVAKTLAQKFLEGFRNGVDSHSPSRKMEEIGEDLIDGLLLVKDGFLEVGKIVASSFISGFSTDVQDGITKVFNGISYDPNTNYKILIDDAVAAGDFEKAAELEEIRNAKIDGEGLSYEKTFDFLETEAQLSHLADTYQEQLSDIEGSVTNVNTATTGMIQSTIELFDTSLTDALVRNEDFCDSMIKLFQDMKTKSVNAISAIISALNSIPRNITTTHTIITVEKTRESSSSSPKTYAIGGFPEQGELFIAREAGPELVGTMGGRTAVANNDQIIAGISNGVAEANAQQNALLQEQNELLRAILAKTGVTIDGKQIKAAYDKATRQAGATIATGGVIYG